MTAPDPDSEGPPAHILSFDVEEYFQVEAAAGHVSPDDWSRYDSRVASPVERILGLLDEWGARATFFILGWVARRQRDLVRRIAGRGHEVASHGMTHRMLQRMAPEDLRRELLDSRRLLEDLAARPVVGFRAPTFSLTRRTAWMIDVLAECGYRFDSSVYPIRHDRYGVPEAPRGPHLAVGPAGGTVVEMPPLTARVLGVNLPVGGGGYLRLLPVHLVGWALSGAARRGDRGVLYLHPWELDAGQPVLPMGRLSRWRHRVNLNSTDRKLRWLLGRFAFGDLGSAASSLEPATLPTFRYA